MSNYFQHGFSAGGSGMIVLVILALLVLAVMRRRIQDSPRTGNDAAAPVVTDQFGTAYELYDLIHRAAQHTTPDAIVRVPNGFDPAGPLHLVVYNHGFYTDIQGAYRDFKLAEQMRSVQPNTILFVPEWQRRPGAASGDQGNFSQPGLFRDMVNEAFSKISLLRGKTLDDVRKITILAHSAGYGPAESEIYNNDLADKVVNLTLLDALYDRYGFDRWLQDNLSELSAGRKRFHNVFFGTATYSKSQAQSVKALLERAGLPKGMLNEDYDKGDVVMDAAALAAHSIVFKYSSARVDNLEPHFSIPHLYVQAATLASDRA